MLVIDFETKDPFISKKMGGGWVYGIENPDSGFKILGASIYDPLVSLRPSYFTNELVILKNVLRHNTYVMHNAQYDLGCLLYLANKYAVDLKLKDKTIIDTMIMAHLHNSSRESYSLDNLAKEFFNERKDMQVLRDAVHQADLKPYTLAELNAKKRADKKGEAYTRTRPSDAILDRLAMSNLDKLPPEVVGHYCNKDVELTFKLFKALDSEVPRGLVVQYSNLAIPCCLSRVRGLPVNTATLEVNKTLITAKVKEQERKVYELAGQEFNIHSSEETTGVLARTGIKCPLTDKGSPSATTPWLETQSQPLCEAIVLARQSHKVGNDFLDSIALKLAETGGTKIYPELNILRARTGRFSCSNPNIQQIPADPDYSKICRGIYEAPEGQNFYALDYSNQEGRIQLHLAVALKCSRAVEFATLAQDPEWDMHQTIADMIGIDRKKAKAINLGLSYGMGQDKLAKQLGVHPSTAYQMIDAYFEAVPYLKELIAHCKNTLRERGSIKTLGGRYLTIDPPVFYNGRKKTFEYKGLNKATQGGAADQTMKAMWECYQAGLEILFPVHDELTHIGNDQTAKAVKDIMVNTFKLHVPVVVKVKKGKTWGDVKEIDL
jgi:DNA polymerase-1